MNALVLPGQPIVPVHTSNHTYVSGPNTLQIEKTVDGTVVPCIVATTLGSVHFITNDNTSTVSVQSSGAKIANFTPSENDVVIAKVTKISSNKVHLDILHVQDASIHLSNLLLNDYGENFKAVIRSTDIRSTDRDKVKVGECFRPGDIVKALVISLGDGINYYLSTARNDLGVIHARSKSGKLLYPLDWETMVVPETGELEPRKCANIN
ncbi:hypothetical protein KL934_000440 [Ogataea polymorpha]|nr:hypothetical protein KL934_000440 [Ogataea polymorpha]